MADIDPFEGAPSLPKIVAISLQQTGHLYNFLAGDRPLRRGERVLVESEAGARVGTVEVEPHEPAQTIDLFYFVAEGRVDFRDLVRDLANTLRVRVEMKQIGARDETKVTGGLGPCGRELCCSSWLRDFEAVTVKMAREQGLALNPSRLAGMCGRLKCCLRYEYATYVELKRALPNLGKRVQCVKGDGKVVRQNILKQTVLIQREEDGGVVEVTLEDLVASRPQ